MKKRQFPSVKRTLRGHSIGRRKYNKAVLFGLSFAVVGVFAVLVTRAATPTASFEAESGTKTAAISTVTDSAASAGSAVKFTPAVTPPPGPCAATKRTITAQDVTNRLNSGYPAGTQVYVPDGPDPWGGCFPGPSNTGIPAGTALTNYTGACTVTTANTTIDSKTMNCNLIIRAANVTVKNSKINGGNIWIESGSLTLSDSEVNLGSNINDEGLRGSNFTVLRANMYGGKRQAWCISTCTVKDSYLHDQLSDPTGVTHESAVRVEQYTTLIHNTILCNAPEFPPDAGCSADQTGYPDFAAIHDNTMDKNFYSATTGGYCAYGGASNGKPYSNDPQNATNIKLTNNVFQRGTKPNDRTTIAHTDKRRYTCGLYGVTTAFDSSRPGFLASGNMWDDGLLFVNDTTYPYGDFY